MDCPALLPPAHGYFLRNECKNVFNAACGVRCHSGYQVGLGLSLTYSKPFTSFLALASDCAYPLVHGVESRPSARLKRVGQCNRPPTAMSPAPHTTMKLTPPASLGRQGFYPKAFPGAILVIAYWDQGKDSAFPYLSGVAFLRTANVSFPHPYLISFPSDQVSPTEKAQLW